MTDPVTDSSTPNTDDEPRSEPPRLLIAVIIGALVAVIVLVVVAITVSERIESSPVADTGPLAVPSVPAPGASGQWCAALHSALPTSLADRPQRQVIGDYQSIAAWGDPAIIARCGLEDPAELTCFAELATFTAADGRSVTWLRLEEGGSVTYIAADRPVRIAVTLPLGSGGDPVAELSEVIDTVIPSQPVCEGGVLTPADNS